MKISDGILMDAKVCWMYSNTAVEKDPLFAGVSDDIITAFMLSLFSYKTLVDVYVEA
jgi:hypothetical protein